MAVGLRNLRRLLSAPASQVSGARCGFCKLEIFASSGSLAVTFCRPRLAAPCGQTLVSMRARQTAYLSHTLPLIALHSWPMKKSQRPGRLKRTRRYPRASLCTGYLAAGGTGERSRGAWWQRSTPPLAGMHTANTFFTTNVAHSLGYTFSQGRAAVRCSPTLSGELLCGPEPGRTGQCHLVCLYFLLCVAPVKLISVTAARTCAHRRGCVGLTAAGVLWRADGAARAALAAQPEAHRWRQCVQPAKRAEHRWRMAGGGA